MKKLSAKECGHLEKLLKRAIVNEQFGMRVQTLGHDPLTGENDVELFMGNGTADYRCDVISTVNHGEEPVDPDDESKGWREYTRDEVHLFIPDDAINSLSGEA